MFGVVDVVVVVVIVVDTVVVVVEVVGKAKLKFALCTRRSQEMLCNAKDIKIIELYIYI